MNCPRCKYKLISNIENNNRYTCINNKTCSFELKQWENNITSYSFLVGNYYLDYRWKIDISETQYVNSTYIWRVKHFPIERNDNKNIEDYINVATLLYPDSKTITLIYYEDDEPICRIDKMLPMDISLEKLESLLLLK